jgi:NTP pyrophosphatase (non-canonical NTP hydrolase)
MCLILNFNEYQEKSLITAIYPCEKGLEYTTLGLVGEAGEIANKVKKIIRDNNSILSEEQAKSLGEELGDVLWYCAALAHELGVNLTDVASNNIKKLNSRKERGVIGGSGDER